MEVWLCDLTHDQVTLASDTFPTNVGYLGAYLKAKSRHQHNVRIFKYPGKLAEALKNGQRPDIIGFSHFMWNGRISYAFAEAVKAADPSISVVFGGLNFPIEKDRAADWLREHPAVDFHIVKEGENALLSLVDTLVDSKSDIRAAQSANLAGVNCIRPDGSLHMPAPAPRVSQLIDIPSPYLTGLLDEFFDGRLMPLITTNRGCPFSCTFCAEGQSYYNKVNRSSVERVVEEVEYIAKRMTALGRDRARQDMYITDSNFGMYKQDIEVATALRDLKRKLNWPQYIQATTGKNQPERVLQVAEILEGSMRLAGTVQSLDPDVLLNVRRSNIQDDALLSVAYRAQLIGANSYSDVILGLPGDSLIAHKDTVYKLLDAGFNYLALYQLRLQNDAEMATAEYRAKHNLKGRFRVLQRSGGYYDLGIASARSVVEVEEVCVEGSKLPYDDYLKAREFDFIVSLFYYDRMFDGVLHLLDKAGVTRSTWIKEIEQAIHVHPELKALLEAFITETHNETYDSEAALLDATETEPHVEELKAGDIGANLIGKYRILGLMEHTDAVFQLGGDCAINALRKSGTQISDSMIEVARELCEFEKQRKRGVFSVNLEDDVIEMSFDISRLTEANDDLESLRYPSAQRVRFYRTPETQQLVERNKLIFGDTAMGRYRQWTRTHSSHLARKVEYLG